VAQVGQAPERRAILIPWSVTMSVTRLRSWLNAQAHADETRWTYGCLLRLGPASASISGFRSNPL